MVIQIVCQASLTISSDSCIAVTNVDSNTILPGFHAVLAGAWSEGPLGSLEEIGGHYGLFGSRDSNKMLTPQAESKTIQRVGTSAQTASTPTALQIPKNLDAQQPQPFKNVFVTFASCDHNSCGLEFDYLAKSKPPLRISEPWQHLVAAAKISPVAALKNIMDNPPESFKPSQVDKDSKFASKPEEPVASAGPAESRKEIGHVS